MTFSNESTEQTVVVNIVDDDLLEINEVFTAKLEFVNGNDADHLTLQPVEVSVTILDNDSECSPLHIINARRMRTRVTVVCYQSTACLRCLRNKINIATNRRTPKIFNYGISLKCFLSRVIQLFFPF